MQTFYLGTHEASWLRKTDAPLFISRRRLAKLNRLPRARGPVGIDSGGFTELSMYGEWTVSVKQYVEEVRRFVDCIGNIQFAAQQDWMTEEVILKKTGLTVEDHQRKTLENYLDLINAAPELPWAPVIQGWTWGDYMRHAEAYQKAGIDLSKPPVVGVGSICRRQATLRIGTILACLQDTRAKLHCFGMKTRGLPLNQKHIGSSDSLAWSFRARRSPPLPECDHPCCNSCLRFALRWRAKLLKLLRMPNHVAEPPVEQTLF